MYLFQGDVRPHPRDEHQCGEEDKSPDDNIDRKIFSVDNILWILTWVDVSTNNLLDNTLKYLGGGPLFSALLPSQAAYISTYGVAPCPVIFFHLVILFFWLLL